MWKRLCLLILGVTLSVSPGLPLEEYDKQIPGHYLNTFLIEVENQEAAVRVARDNGFQLVHKLPEMEMYLLEHPEVTGRSKRNADDFVARLKQDSRVKFAEQQITLERVKRNHEVIHDKQLEFPIREIVDKSEYYRVEDKFDTRDQIGPKFDDELFDDQWSLINTGQTGGLRGIDINVAPVWDMGFDGRGVVVTTLDDGIDHEHPDLRNNYDPEASADMNDKTDKENDPEPDKSSLGNSHGTRCAGEIAAEANNGVCGAGVAPKASIGGIRILDGEITDELEARALLYNNQHIDIYSASWGPKDSGATMEGPKRACANALKRGVETGRGGLGSIYVWATGNGGVNGDMCGADGYVSSPESISVQSGTDHGDIPFFGEVCSSTMITVPTGGEHTEKEELKAQYKIKVVTIDINGGCIENFEGTSSAAPMASGVYALVLQANPKLSWRDVQHITASGARIPIVDEAWTINGAGYHVNPNFGFGLIDTAQMVELAQSWESVPEQHICETDRVEVNKVIDSSECYKTRFNFDGCRDDDRDSINSMEHVQLVVRAKSGRRGNVEIYLTSPAGTRSVMLSFRPTDNTDEEIDFTFMTVHNWGESPEGEWIVEVCDNPGPQEKHHGNTIEFNSYALRVYGFYANHKQPDKKSKQPSRAELLSKKSSEFKRSRQVVIKRAEGGLSRSVAKEEKDAKAYASKVDTILAKIGDLFSKKSFSADHFSNTRNNINNNLHERMYDFGKRGYSSSNLNVKESKLDITRREILEILEELDKRGELHDDYLKSYLEEERELERKQEIQSLIREIDEILEDDVK